MSEYRIVNASSAPVSRRKTRRWTLPLEDIGVGQVLMIDMAPTLQDKEINAIRSFVSREQKRLGRKFSVHRTEEGITIFRAEMKEDPDN